MLMQNLRWLTSLSIVIIVTACGGGGGGGSPATPVTFEVSNTSPVNNSVGMNLDFPIRTTLSKVPDTSTIDVSNVLLNEGVNVVTISPNHTGSGSIDLNPAATLQRNTQYSAILKAGITDLDGNTLASDYTWSFTTSWTVQAGSTSTDKARDVAVDGSGNIYTLTQTEGGIDGKTNSGLSDFAIVKHNSAGVLQWSAQFGSTQVDTPKALTLTSDSVYVTGITEGDIDGAGSITAFGNTDIVVARYSLDGTFQWLAQYGTTLFDEAYDITTDGTDIFVTGFSNGDVDGGGPQTPFGDGAADLIVMKLNNAGALQWVTQSGGSLYDRGNGIVVNGTDIYVSGYTFGDFDGAGSLTTAGKRDIILAKFDSNGTLLWKDQVGTSEDDTSKNIAVDAGSIYITGDTRGGLNGNTHAGGSCNNGAVVPCRDVFVTKYSTSGTRDWTYQTGSIGEEIGFDIKVDGTSLYIAGVAGGQVNSQIFWGTFDMLTMKLNTSGAHQWTRLRGTQSSSATDEAFGIAMFGTNLYVAGSSNENLNGLQSVGGFDAYITKYNTDGLLY